ncbi:MAG: 2-hydroxychromene-2-carboxylate isomerase [Rubrobacteraceae bacterium]
MRRVEFFFDLVSPYSYLAHTQVGRVCEEAGAELVLCPMLLGAVLNETGGRAATEVPAKERYMMRDLEMWAESYGAPLRFPDPFPFRSLKTLRAALWLRERGRMAVFVNEAFSLYWAEGGAPKGMKEADEDGPIAEAARRIGEDPDEILEGATQTSAKKALKTATAEALERGVFGAPAFFVDDEMFWGNDRLPFVEAALGRD